VPGHRLIKTVSINLCRHSISIISSSSNNILSSKTTDYVTPIIRDGRHRSDHSHLNEIMTDYHRTTNSRVQPYQEANLRQLSLLVSTGCTSDTGRVCARSGWQVYTYIFAVRALRARRPPTVLCKHKARTERVCVCTGPAIYLHIHTHTQF
jgi:hypothetical protein